MIEPRVHTDQRGIIGQQHGLTRLVETLEELRAGHSDAGAAHHADPAAGQAAHEGHVALSRGAGAWCAHGIAQCHRWAGGGPSEVVMVGVELADNKEDPFCGDSGAGISTPRVLGRRHEKSDLTRGARTPPKGVTWTPSVLKKSHWQEQRTSGSPKRSICGPCIAPP